MKPPKELKDHRSKEAILFDANTADKYADKGTVLHFALRLGFFPNTEEEAEELLIRLLLEKEYYEMCIALEESKNVDYNQFKTLPKFHLDTTPLES